MATISTSLRMYDMMSRPLQQVNQAINMTVTSMEHMNNASNRDLGITNSLIAARNSIRQAEAGLNQLAEEQNRVANSQNHLNESFRNGGSATDSLLGKVKGLIGAYIGIQTAKQGIESTIGGAMKMQQQLFTIQGIMGNKDIATAYFDHINDMANKSVFSLNDFAGSARKFMQFTKNTDSLDKILNLNERLALVDPTQGFEGAGFALKEMMSGDGTSLKERFGFGKADIEILKASKDMGTFITQFDKLLNKKGFTENMLEQYNKSAAAQFDNLKSNIETSLAQAGNGALEKLAPVLTNLNQTFNNGGFQGFFNNLSNGLAGTINLLIKLGYGVQSIGNFVQSNWSIIAPIVGGITIAFGLWTLAVIANNTANSIGKGIQIASTIASYGLATAKGVEVGATEAATAAQYGLNTAMLACPVTWIILIIIALIAIFYGAVAAVNHFAGTSYSATGLIAGAFSALGVMIYNSIAYSWNVIAAFVEFFANVFNHPMYSVNKLFVSLATNVLDMCISMTSGFDSFATNMANAMVDGVNVALEAWNGFVEALDGLGIAEKLGLSKADKIGHSVSITSDLQNMKASLNDSLGEAPSDYWTAPRMEMKSVGGAFDWGYGKGAGLESYVGNMFSGLDSAANNANNLTPDFDSWNKTQGPGNLSFGNDDKKNLKNINDKIDVSNEHLEMLRDMAEEKSIQNFVTLTPTVTFGDTHVKEEADINKIISHIENYMENELQNSAEGLYA